MRRVLFVSYLFPPVGGVGVHRVTKFVKYLPQFGWESTVLTVGESSVPLLDDSLLKDTSPGTARIRKVCGPGSRGYAQRSRSRRPSRRAVADCWAKITAGLKAAARHVGNTILQPDAQILWQWNAIREGMRGSSRDPARRHHRLGSVRRSPRSSSARKRGEEVGPPR